MRGGSRGLALAAAVAVLGLVWWRLAAESLHKPEVRSAVAVRPARAEAVETAASAPVGASPLAGAASASRLAADEVDICGTVVKVGSDGEPAEGWLERLPGRPRAREQVIATLRAALGEYERALGDLLEPGPGAVSSLLLYPCESEGCPSAAVLADGERRRNALARRAVSSNDAKLYALAFKLCSAGPVEPGAMCRQLNVAQWVRLDPGNASPWFFALNAAKKRGDRAAQEEALFRIGSAQHSRLGFHDLVGAVLDAAPDGEASKPTMLEMATQAVGMSSQVTPSYGPLLAMCQPADLADANRAQACDAVAKLMTERSDALIERGIGTSLGERLGWPKERTDRLRGEYDEFVASRTSGDGPSRSALCAPIDHNLQALRRSAKIGETGVLREWVLESGRPPEAFASARREAVAKRAAAAAAENAANVASAASAARAAGAVNATSAASGAR